jgi:hypothetical protein
VVAKLGVAGQRRTQLLVLHKARRRLLRGCAQSARCDGGLQVGRSIERLVRRQAIVQWQLRRADPTLMKVIEVAHHGGSQVPVQLGQHGGVGRLALHHAVQAGGQVGGVVVGRSQPMAVGRGQQIDGIVRLSGGTTCVEPRHNLRTARGGRQQERDEADQTDSATSHALSMRRAIASVMTWSMASTQADARRERIPC